MLWMLKNLVRRSILHTFSKIHDHDLIRNMFYNGKVMCDKDIRQIPVLLQIHQKIQDLCLNRYVKRRYRFVTDDKFRIEDQCAGDPDSLPPSAVQLMWVSRCKPWRQSDDLHDLIHTIIDFLSLFAQLVDN